MRQHVSSEVNATSARIASQRFVIMHFHFQHINSGNLACRCTHSLVLVSLDRTITRVQ